MKHRYIPKGSTLVRDKHSDAVAYLYTARNGKPAAIMYGGKRAKKDRHYNYPNEAVRAEQVADYFQSQQAIDAYKAKRRKERNDAPRGLEIGDIVNTCWGYEQTNREFYQITKLVGTRMVEAREIAQTSEATGWAAWLAGGVKDDFIGQPFRTVARNGNIKAGPRNSYIASKWDGNPCHASSYH